MKNVAEPSQRCWKRVVPVPGTVRLRGHRCCFKPSSLVPVSWGGFMEMVGPIKVGPWAVSWGPCGTLAKGLRAPR